MAPEKTITAASAPPPAYSVVAPMPGVATTGMSPMSVLDLEIDNLDKRLGICLGSKEEVDTFNRFMFA